MRYLWHRRQGSQHCFSLVVDGTAAHGAEHVSSMIAMRGSRSDSDTCASKLNALVRSLLARDIVGPLSGL